MAGRPEPRPPTAARPLAQLHHLQEMGPVVIHGDRVMVRMPISGSTTVWLRIFGTAWLEQTEVQAPQPNPM